MAFKAFHGGGLTAENSTVILEVGEIVQFFCWNTKAMSYTTKEGSKK